MFDAELDGAQVLLVVAQRPFEAESENGVVNAFSLLKPVVHADGRPTSDWEFPDNGYVWWMLRPGTRGFAEPGRLLSATLEPAKGAQVANKSWYQARVASIEPVRAAAFVEIVEAPPDWVAEPREMLARNRTLPCKANRQKPDLGPSGMAGIVQVLCRGPGYNFTNATSSDD
jgi:hypothetical protein